jgi:hypothetical protein
VYISDRDSEKEKAFRRKDIYSFYFMLATESRRRKAEQKADESFGAARHDKRKPSF